MARLLGFTFDTLVFTLRMEVRPCSDDDPHTTNKVVQLHLPVPVMARLLGYTFDSLLGCTFDSFVFAMRLEVRTRSNDDADKTDEILQLYISSCHGLPAQLFI